MNERKPRLEVSDLSVEFKMYDKGVKQKAVRVITNLSLSIYPGEILAVVGSSGSGKSLLASAILGILPKNASVSGKLNYEGEVLKRNRMEELRGKKIALVPQSVVFLDPLMKVGRQVDGHQKPYPKEKRKKLFQRLGLPEKTEKCYPNELSGGMARRVLVSTALISEADLVIADEPTPGMSLEQAKEALSMFREMAKEGKSVILITHDIDLASEFADRIAVFYAGTTVETTPVEDFRVGPERLRHPYTKALWRALPQNGFQPIKGFQPYAESLPNGCLFNPRCPYRTGACISGIPEMRELREGEVRCFNAT